MKRLVLLAVMLLGTAQLMGCAAAAIAPYEIYEDKREIGTIADDSKIKSHISSEFSKSGISGASVYSYEGHVFIVGEVNPRLRGKASQIAHQTAGMHSVDFHWFSKAKSKDGDFTTAAKLRTNLISADGLISSRVDTEINAGRVVLLGMVESEQEKDIAIQAARATSGVREVKSLLIIKR